MVGLVDSGVLVLYGYQNDGVYVFSMDFLFAFGFLSMCLFVGSENNSLCVYYKGLSELLLSHRFGSVRSLLVSL